ncbi:MAG: efflux RND transporter periplasmic adaptor subunit [Syntrophomonas sp.]
MVDVLMKNKKVVFITLGVAAIMTIIISKAMFTNPDQIIPASKAIAVQIFTVKEMEFASASLYKANLQPVEEGIISSKINGQVNQILFKNGDHVSQGQPLAILDDSDLNLQLSAAQVKVQSLELVRTSTEKQYNRIKTLYDSGAVSQSELETADTALRTAEYNLAAEKINLQSINNSLYDTKLCSPISGVIDEKDVRKGQYVNPGSVLAKVKDNSSLFAVTYISFNDLKQVTVGQHVIVKLAKGDEKGYDGIIESMVDAADDSTRLFPCRIRVENADGSLHSGVFGYVEIPLTSAKESLVVPLEALTGREGDYSVFTVEDNMARKHSVAIGRISDNMAQVLNGLHAGDKVIVTNLNELSDGDPIVINGQGV